MKKSGPDRQYTEDFRQSAVKQVIDGGRSIPQVARSLEIPKGTLGNWVWRIRKGEPLMKRPPLKPVTELEAEVTRLRAENARLKVEKEILKKRRRTLRRSRCEVRLDRGSPREVLDSNDVRAACGVA